MVKPGYLIKTKSPRRYKWPIRIAVAVVLYTLIGFFAIPAIIKWQMLKQLPGITKRQVTVRQVRFNPYAMSMTIRGFSLKEPEGEVFSSFDEFYINFQPWASLFKRSWVFSEISLKDPYAQVTYKEDGTFNFANLLTNSAPATSQPAKPATLPKLIVYNLFVTNGGLAFNDLKRKDPFHTEFVPINVNLTNLTTIRDKNSPYSFLARTDSGESFAWSGTITLNPLRSAGLFRLGGLKLGKYATYSHDYAKFEIANGLLDVAADYDYDSSTNVMDLKVSKAAVHLTNLELKAPDTGETVLNLPAFSITDTEANIVDQTARVGMIKSSGGSVLVRQNHDGTINLLSLLNSLPVPVATAKTNTDAPASPETVKPWSVKIDEIAFEGYAIKAEDKKPEKAANLDIDQLGFDLKGVSNASNAPVTVSVSLRFQQAGTINVQGTTTLLPPSADLQVALTNIDLRAVEPYVAEQVKLAITSGSLDVQGKAIYGSTNPGAPMASFTGNVAINKFATTDDVLFKELATWDALGVNGIQLTVQPDKLHVDQIKFTKLSTSGIVGPDKRINLQTILRNRVVATAGTNKAAASAQSVAVANSPKPKLPDILIDSLEFDSGSVHFGDQSLEPHCNFDVAEFSGSIKGLSSQENTTATVDLKGKVDSRSPFSVTGKINPLAKDLFADVTVTFTNTELTAFTPYAEKFAGRPLQKGKLSFAVHYLIKTNVLKAENGVFVDQLTLGPKNNSPDATKLPVKLGVALLKDMNGRIKLDIPVNGRIDDPKFRLAPIIWHVVVNLLEKAATSPFSLLGSLIGGGGEEMSFVAFEPGKSDVPEVETKKLDNLAKALQQRPALSLEINGSVDPVKDLLPLAEVKLDQQFKAMLIKERTDSGKDAMAIDQVVLEPKDRERLLKKLHKQTFGRYKPTEIATNNSSEAKAQSSVAQALASIANEESRGHGASLLRAQPVAQTVILTTSPSKPATPGKPPRPLTAYEIQLLDMEDQLVRKISVTQDDYRDLMQQRANKVQAYLLKTEKVTADRLFVTAPKPMGPATKGEDKVNLTLD